MERLITGGKTQTEQRALKTVIITGANSGLGFEAAKKIADDKSFQLFVNFLRTHDVMIDITSCV